MHRHDESIGVAPNLESAPAIANTVTGSAGIAGLQAAAAPAPPIVPKKVIVVDDELAGMTFAHFRESAAGFITELEDLTSPSAEAAWAVVAQLQGKKPFGETSSAEIAACFASDEFVRDVVLSEAFRSANVPRAEELTRFYERAQGVDALKGMLQTAYASPAFELTFVATRPMPVNRLMAYDLAILDLVLLQSAGAVDELVGYLKDLGTATYPSPLPCLIVLSSRQEMVENRPRFSTDSSISAAGLLLLEKGHVRNAQFGAAGFKLAYQQLERQRDAAQHMRVFVKDWMTALEAARTAAAETLWNLDAAAMQEIHLSATSDDDPYDEHLNDLVAREYLYHVEASTDVARAIEALDGLFQKRLKLNGTKWLIEQRCMAPFVDSKPGRTIVSHYNWTGLRPIGPLDRINADDLSVRLNRLVPFGAVVAPPDLVAGSECWVHITPQCDLNRAMRDAKSGTTTNVSAMFAVVSMVAVNDRTVPVHDNDQLVARGLRVGNMEFDLKLVKGRLISLPIDQLIDTVRTKMMQVVGRLRHDIANQFLNATANHMTRPAQLKSTRVEVRPGKVYLWGAGMPDNAPAAFREPDSNAACTVLVSQNNKLHYFQDDASMRLALWVAEQLRMHFAKPGLDAATICNTLRVGISKGATVISVLNLMVEKRAFDALDTFWTEREPPKTPQLYVFHEPG